MTKIYYIYDYKPVMYTYKVYAKSEADALAKIKTQDYEEIGLDPGVWGKEGMIVSEGEEVFHHCQECDDEYSPENVRDYLCGKCRELRE